MGLFKVDRCSRKKGLSNKSASYNYVKRYLSWVNSSEVDDRDKQILSRYSDLEIKNLFSSDNYLINTPMYELIGADSFNKYRLRREIQGFINYIDKNKDSKEKMVFLIGVENSKLYSMYAEEIARVILAKDGFVYMFKDSTSDFLVSYGTSKLDCSYGIFIKEVLDENLEVKLKIDIYDSKGKMIDIEEIYSVSSYIDKLEDFKNVYYISYNEYLNSINENTIYVDNELKREYTNDIIKKLDSDIENIIYDSEKGILDKSIKSVIYNVSSLCVLPPNIDSNIIKNLSKEKEASLYIDDTLDYNFINNVKSTSPSKSKSTSTTFDSIINKAKTLEVDYIFIFNKSGSDLTMLYKNEEGEFILLTGTMLGSIILNYLIKEGIINHSFVSKVGNYKNLVDMMLSIENNKSYKESRRLNISINENGVMNNDSIFTYCFMLYILKDLKERKIATEYNLVNIYEKYNYFDEKLMKIEYNDEDMKNKIFCAIDRLRKIPIDRIYRYKVTKTIDYLDDENPINKIEYHLEDSSTITCEILDDKKTFIVYLGVFDVSYNAVKVKKDMFYNFIEKNILKDLIF